MLSKTNCEHFGHCEARHRFFLSQFPPSAFLSNEFVRYSKICLLSIFVVPLVKIFENLKGNFCFWIGNVSRTHFFCKLLIISKFKLCNIWVLVLLVSIFENIHLNFRTLCFRNLQVLKSLISLIMNLQNVANMSFELWPAPCGEFLKKYLNTWFSQ